MLMTMRNDVNPDDGTWYGRVEGLSWCRPSLSKPLWALPALPVLPALPGPDLLVVGCKGDRCRRFSMWHTRSRGVMRKLIDGL